MVLAYIKYSLPGYLPALRQSPGRSLLGNYWYWRFGRSKLTDMWLSFYDNKHISPYPNSNSYIQLFGHYSRWYFVPWTYWHLGHSPSTEGHWRTYCWFPTHIPYLPPLKIRSPMNPPLRLGSVAKNRFKLVKYQPSIFHPNAWKWRWLVFIVQSRLKF